MASYKELYKKATQRISDLESLIEQAAEYIEKLEKKEKTSKREFKQLKEEFWKEYNRAEAHKEEIREKDKQIGSLKGEVLVLKELLREQNDIISRTVNKSIKVAYQSTSLDNDVVDRYLRAEKEKEIETIESPKEEEEDTNELREMIKEILKPQLKIDTMA